MLKTVVTGLALVALSAPVAAGAAEYWVVKDPTTQKCVVVQHQPPTPAIRKAFDSPEAAHAAMGKSVACGGVD